MTSKTSTTLFTKFTKSALTTFRITDYSSYMLCKIYQSSLITGSMYSKRTHRIWNAVAMFINPTKPRVIQYSYSTMKPLKWNSNGLCRIILEPSFKATYSKQRRRESSAFLKLIGFIKTECLWSTRQSSTIVSAIRSTKIWIFFCLWHFWLSVPLICSSQFITLSSARWKLPRTWSIIWIQYGVRTTSAWKKLK